MCLYLLIAAIITCGFIMIFLRGVVPDTGDWSIVHETDGELFIRTETGKITEDYLGQIIAINTTRQFLDVYINNEHILSSQDYGYTAPITARYGIRVTPEMVGGDIRIVFSAPDIRENMLMGNSLSFQRINTGFAAFDYSIAAICTAAGIAVLVFAFALGIRGKDSISIWLFVFMNFALALNTIGSDTLIAFDWFEPRSLYITSYIMFFTYMLPMLAFLNMSLTRLWKKCAFIFLLSTAIYPAAVFILDAARIMPVGLSERGYNYILALSMAILTSMLALQPIVKNRFVIIARIHMVLWAAWGLFAALRLLVFDVNVYINVEYRLVYGFTLISLTFFGIFIFARNFNDLQKREYAMSIKTESLLQNYEQLNTHFHEVNRLKHDMKNHLSMLNIFLKDNRLKEAQRYLDKYADEVGEITEAAFHENYIINAVAHDLSHRGQIIGANVELNLKASPRNISEPDLISLLTNIIDNALEACTGMPPEMERLIRLSVTRREPYLAIVCENNYHGRIDKVLNGEGIRSNKNEIGHGYGLNTIERISGVYDGMVELSYDENLFTITVALKDKE